MCSTEWEDVSGKEKSISKGRKGRWITLGSCAVYGSMKSFLSVSAVHCFILWRGSNYLLLFPNHLQVIRASWSICSFQDQQGWVINVHTGRKGFNWEFQCCLSNFWFNGFCLFLNISPTVLLLIPPEGVLSNVNTFTSVPHSTTNLPGKNILLA